MYVQSVLKFLSQFLRVYSTNIVWSVFDVGVLSSEAYYIAWHL
jgi:hypothetical protein